MDDNIINDNVSESRVSSPVVTHARGLMGAAYIFLMATIDEYDRECLPPEYQTDRVVLVISRSRESMRKLVAFIDAVKRSKSPEVQEALYAFQVVVKIMLEQLIKIEKKS